MLSRLTSTTVALVLTISASALAQDVAAPPAWSALADQKFAFHREGVRISPSVAPNEIIISIPITHLRTAVVLDAVTEPDTGVPLLDAGAPGYYAGHFGDDDVWCFRRSAPAPAGRAACFAQRAGVWYLAGAPNNDEYPTSVQISALLPPVPSLRFEEGGVGATDIRADYRLRRWTRQAAEVDLLIGGRPVLAGNYRVYQTYPRQADGAVLLTTPVGVVRLSQSADARSVSVNNVSVNP